MNIVNTCLFIITLNLVACSPNIRSKVKNATFGPLPSNKEILVLTEHDLVPVNSTLIGNFKIGKSGLATDCGYNDVTVHAKNSLESREQTS